MSPPDPDFAGKLVLLAEDEPAVRNLIRTVLIGSGLHVIVAADGDEALRLSRAYSGHIDLLLTNVQMPKMDGVELATQLQRERPATKVLIISGETSGHLERLSKRDDFLAKPFLPKALLDKIAETLESSDGAPGQI